MLKGKQVFPLASPTAQFPTCRALESHSPFPSSVPISVTPALSELHWGAPHTHQGSRRLLHLFLTVFGFCYSRLPKLSPQRNLGSLHVLLIASTAPAACFSDGIHFRRQPEALGFQQTHRPTNTPGTHPSPPEGANELSGGVSCKK